jgi:hypothetical protein
MPNPAEPAISRPDDVMVSLSWDLSRARCSGGFQAQRSHRGAHALDTFARVQEDGGEDRLDRDCSCLGRLFTGLTRITVDVMGDSGMGADLGEILIRDDVGSGAIDES